MERFQTPQDRTLLRRASEFSISSGDHFVSDRVEIQTTSSGKNLKLRFQQFAVVSLVSLSLSAILKARSDLRNLQVTELSNCRVLCVH